MKTILLTKGKEAMVDDEDYEWLSKFKWYVMIGKSRSGRKNEGYAARRRGRKIIYMHKEILRIGPGIQGDHINRDSLDNRRQNLRVASQQQNSQNRHRINTASQFTGVQRVDRSRKWGARICPIKGKTTFLGIFETETEAAIAYDLAAIKHYREFAKQNFKTINDYINATT